MATVEPIRNRQDVIDLIEYMENESAVSERTRMRNALIISIGVNAGFRVGDIVKLQRKHILGWHIAFQDQKTGKFTKRKMAGTLKERLKVYTEGMKPDDYLFPSREGKGLGKTKKRQKHIQPNTVYKIMKTAADRLGLENIATHSLRKTFGMMLYDQTRDVAIVMGMLNHSSQSITYRYIGKNQDSQDKAMTKYEGF
ncbi:tyrosine-type recombinase/integrase [Streptococcus suis]|nr:tyrosine-type recombinase/integrase [Streptococcus suis]